MLFTSARTIFFPLMVARVACLFISQNHLHYEWDESQGRFFSVSEFCLPLGAPFHPSLSYVGERSPERSRGTDITSGERESRESAITSMALHHNIYYQLFEKQWQIAPARHRYFDAIPATRLAPAPWNEGKSSSKS